MVEPTGVHSTLTCAPAQHPPPPPPHTHTFPEFTDWTELKIRPPSPRPVHSNSRKWPVACVIISAGLSITDQNTGGDSEWFWMSGGLFTATTTTTTTITTTTTAASSATTATATATTTTTTTTTTTATTTTTTTTTASTATTASSLICFRFYLTWYFCYLKCMSFLFIINI